MAPIALRAPRLVEGFMLLSREARLVSAITLLVVPTIMYGGWTLLGILTRGVVSTSPNVHLNDMQWALWRAGHAHAGVWTMLSLLLQIFLDAARLSVSAKWIARICAPLAAVFLSAGFFGVSVSASFRWLIYFGVLSMLTALLLTAFGLIHDLRRDGRQRASSGLD
jgi:hypothetical protein